MHSVTRHESPLSGGEAKRLVLNVTDYLNTLSDEDPIKEFVAAMAEEHRTLQQGFTRLVVAWLRHLASLPDNRYDARNEASVKLARKLLGSLDEYETHLPLI